MVCRDSSLCSWVCRDKPQLKSNALQASYLKSEGCWEELGLTHNTKALQAFLHLYLRTERKVDLNEMRKCIA